MFLDRINIMLNLVIKVPFNADIYLCLKYDNILIKQLLFYNNHKHNKKCIKY